jgi:nitronate monooxygenase
MQTIKKLEIGDLVLDVPIIQGGMGVKVSGSSLASAVSVEGGLGVIASVGLAKKEDLAGAIEDISRDALISEIRKVKAKGLPVGVNNMVALRDFERYSRICAEEGVDVIIAGAGLPLKLPEYVEGSSTKLIPIVSSRKGARVICDSWWRRYKRLPDAIVVEGPMAGGHLGFHLDELKSGKAPKVEDIMLEVKELMGTYEDICCRKIPVIVAGGVFTGSDIARMMKLGADGVQMATRFVTTYECDVADEYKQAFLDATEEDVTIIASPVGLPGKVIRGKFVERILAGEKINFSCPYRCLRTCNPTKVNYCIADALLNAADGNMDEGFAMCGSNVHRIDKIVSVKELITELVTEATECLSGSEEKEVLKIKAT